MKTGCRSGDGPGLKGKDSLVSLSIHGRPVIPFMSLDVRRQRHLPLLLKKGVHRDNAMEMDLRKPIITQLLDCRRDVVLKDQAAPPFRSLGGFKKAPPRISLLTIRIEMLQDQDFNLPATLLVSEDPGGDHFGVVGNQQVPGLQ